MSEHEKLKMICSECGNCPVDAGGDVAVYTNRVRRRVLLVWLGLVFLVGVLGLPWVQVRLGNWNAIWDDGPFIPNAVAYTPLADPPFRWKDLEQAAGGDVAAIDQFQESFIGFDELYSGMASKEYQDYSFQIGEPKYFTEPVDGDYGYFEGEAYPYSLSSIETDVIGWPTPWVSCVTKHRYAYGDRRFDRDELLSVEDDMIHDASVARRIWWSTILFLSSVIVMGGYAVWRACILCGVRRGYARFAGLIAVGLFMGTILVVGSQYRVKHEGSWLAGYVEPILTVDQRAWNRVDAEKIFLSDIATREIAQKLVNDFGEMTRPNEMVALGISHRAWPADYDLSFGWGRFRLLGCGKVSYVQLETDGAYTAIPIPEEDVGWSSWSGNGMIALGRSWGQPAMVSYGGLIEYQNLFFVGVGMYVLLRVLRGIGFWCSRRVQRRRVGRGVCVWCGYPCGGE